jgi:hypothetical protein
VKAYELIKETFCRKSFIPITHVVWCALYICFFYVEPAQWGQVLFIVSGILLPLILTAGVYGDDYSSGRMSVLLTRPVGIAPLYLYRLFGVTLQGILNMTAAIGVILLVRQWTGYDDIGKFWIWPAVSGLMFMAWASFSASLSVCMKQAYNFIFIMIGMIVISFLISFIHNPEDIPGRSLLAIIKYAFPPVELLGRLAKENLSPMRATAYVVHALGLTAFYSLVGIVLLSKREIGRE